MTIAPDGRRLFVWRGHEPAADEDRLIELVSEIAASEFFNLNGALVWVNNGRHVPVAKDILRSVINRHIVSVRLANAGTVAAPRWEPQYYSFDFPPGADLSEQPSEQVLRNMLAGTRLLERVARGPRLL